jgi:predicted lipoprotein
VKTYASHFVFYFSIEIFMKRIVILFFACTFLLLVIVNFSCAKKASGTTTDPILINIGNNIILPSYQSYAIAVNSLDSSITDFNQSPNGTKLSNVRVLFKNTYVAWESVSEYDGFGPAENNSPPLSSLNLFPANTTLIENNISATPSSININSYGNQAAKGFPALDYLLFNTDSVTLLVDYTTDAKAANRKQYLATVSTDIKIESNSVVNAWAVSGGNYINTFINGSGTSVSSSLGLLINSADQDLEILKNYRLGVPLGKVLTADTNVISPTQVEAYYSGISAQLALTQLKAIQGIYLGNSVHGNGLGLSNYLTQSNKTYSSYNGSSLNSTIKAGFTLAVTDLQGVADPLSATIQSNPTPVDNAFAETQQLVTLLKTDMPSLLGVAITYGDNDGD